MGTTFVSYQGSKLEPAPFVGIGKSFRRTEDGTIIGTNYQITIQGKILAYMGSPNSSGDFVGGIASHAPVETIGSQARLEAISRKIEALKKLFSQDGKKFSWQSANGAQETYCYPKIVSFNVNPEIWFNTADYNIELEAEYLYGANYLQEGLSLQLQSASESWDFSADTIPNSFSARHTISAVGKLTYNADGSLSGALGAAKQYVQSRVGYDSSAASLALGGLNYGNSNLYNYTLTENIDEPGGSYAVTESWILFNKPYHDNYTVSISNITEDAQKIKTASIRGTIQGLYTGLNNRSLAYANAVSGWNEIKPTIQGRITGNISPVNFISSVVDYNVDEGTVSYNYEYDNKILVSGTYEEFSVERQWGFEDYKTTISINGTIEGKIGEDEELALKFPRAEARWSYVEGQLFSRVSQYASGVGGLKQTPISRSVTKNPINGTIQYSYSYDNRDTERYLDSYSVSYSFERQRAIAVVNVNGTVQGYDIPDSGNILQRYYNALTGMPSEATIYNRAITYGSPLVKNSPTQKEIIKSPQQGTVSYNYTYTSEPTGCLPGIISTSISVSEQKAGDVVAQIGVIGRLQGPVLQDIGSKTARVRTVSVELVQGPPENLCDVANVYANKPEVMAMTIVSGLKPAGYVVYYTDPSDNYILQEGRYTLNVSWLYEV